MENTPLFRGRLVRLTAPVPDQDAEIEARWTQDLDFIHLVSSSIARPLSPYQIKRRYSEQDKERDNRRFHFAVRLISDDRLVGFMRLHHVEWSMGCGWIKVGIGSPADRGKGYGQDTLTLGLRYAFGELNLRRMAASAIEYNLPWIELLKKNGFSQEVCRREAFLREDRRWDALVFGLLREEWMEIAAAKGGAQ